MAENRQKSYIKVLRFSLTLFSLFAVVFLLAYYFYISKTTVRTQKQLLKAEAQKAAGHINGCLLKLAEIGDRLALRLGSADCSDVEGAIHDEIKKNPEIFGVGAAYLPGGHDKERRLYAPYWVKRQKEHKLIYVEDDYDYASGEHAWFELPIKKAQPVWQEPFYGRASNAYLAEYTVPIFKADQSGQKKIVGIVYVNYCLDDIRSFMASLNIGKTGYGAIMSSKGSILYHPQSEMVTQGQTVFDIAEKHNSRQLFLIGQKATAGQSGVEDYKSIFSGRKMWFFFEPVPVANWSLNLLAIKNEMPLKIDVQRRLLFAASAAVMLFLLSLCGLDAVRWRAVIIASFIMIAGTVALWIFVESDNFMADPYKNKLVDKASLEKFIDHYSQQCRNINDGEAPVFIPTGAFVQSIRFSSAHNVVVTGYIWQNYSNVDAKISRGIVLPEAEDCEIKKAYHKNETIGWYFKVNLRERFDYSKYPFDREYVWLRIWHEDFNHNVVLIPDLDAYQYIHPTAKPGIEKDFVLSGWKIQKSFFNFRNNPYNSNFGIKSFDQTEFPELYFNVSLKRSFLNPFVTHLIPLSVVILILFFILMIQRKTDSDGLFGFNSLSAVLGCSALFFVVIFNHIAIRDTLASGRIAYLEYFYFVTYLAILFVSANSFLVARFSNFNLERSKWLFFPTILGVLYLLTFIEFF